MTHMRTMSEHEGEFTKETISHRPCSSCGGQVVVELWESSCGGYEDEKHTCKQCGRSWWVDGPDS
jgi:hypothetical protein